MKQEEEFRRCIECGIIFKYKPVYKYKRICDECLLKIHKNKRNKKLSEHLLKCRPIGLPRPCKVCEMKFQPTGRNNRVCYTCCCRIQEKKLKCNQYTNHTSCVIKSKQEVKQNGKYN